MYTSLGLSKPVSFFNTGFSVFNNSKTGIPVLKPVLNFFVVKLNKTRK
jgi:hypothetical protein